MAATFTLEDSLWQRLQFCPTQPEDNSIGFLFGLWINKTWRGLSVGCVNSYRKPKFLTDLLELRSIFPAGLTVGGIVYNSVQDVKESDAQEFCQTLLQGEDIRISLAVFNEQLLVVPLCKRQPPRVEENGVYSFNIVVHSIQSASIQLIPNGQSMANSLIMRLRACPSLEFEIGEDTQSTRKNIHHAMVSLKSTLTSDVAVFYVKGTDVLLRNSDKKLVTASNVNDKFTCEQLCNAVSVESDEIIEKKKKDVNVIEVLEFDLLMQISGSEAVARSIPCVPIVHYARRMFKNVTVPFLLSVIALVSKTESFIKIPELLSQAISYQLDEVELKLKLFFQGEVFHPTYSYHFQPPKFPHLVTVVYPYDIAEESLESVRKDVHDKLLLAKNRPLFKKVCAFSFPGEDMVVGYLKNVHLGLSPSGISNGNVCIVSGTYDYRHYMQDRFDDNGWGCAYRSLQTIVSWFRYQGYTEKPVPTHREIQQALIDARERPISFLGSKQWIGSLEVSSVLTNMLGVTSKIMPVNSGEDLAYKGRELSFHFDTQGTPIMIGGGVLAHTILGVDYNEVTGNLKFLILDPHYTGDENLKFIQNKGWCGWKGTGFWDKNAHYNLCMPQRPCIV